MASKLSRGLSLLVLLVTFLPIFAVSADTGPKPTMNFSFKQGFSGSPLTIETGTLDQCEQPDCQDAQPLPVEGPQGFSCSDTSCYALSYGFSTYNRLEIEFSDGKTRQSNVFKTSQFQSNYQVTIRQDDLLVTPKFTLNQYSPLLYVLLCLCCLVGVAVVIVVIILLVRRSHKKS